MSGKEVERLEVLQRVRDKKLTQREAACALDLSVRHVQRLCRTYGRQGAAGLVSGRRGRPSNNRLPAAVRETAMALVRANYADFGPTLALEKLRDGHGVKVSRETLRKWMVEEELWTPRSQRMRIVHQPRRRRSCLGELIQIDGCDHEWFEDRAPRCTLLVFVDDATGKLMEIRFVESESAFSYFEATRSYLERHGKPVAFYSDKATVFRVPQRGEKTVKNGTQFSRAMTSLNIDILCANSPQAKGRVERMNLTLQDRLVKELRLADVSSVEAANAFAAGFMKAFNARFANEPASDHDAHRPLRADEDLRTILCWQEDRKLTKNLTVHFRNKLYLVTPTKETRPLAGRRCRVHEWLDGEVAIYCHGQWLPCAVFDKNPHVKNAEVTSNKRLGAVLAMVQAEQQERDKKRWANTKLTLRQKAQIRVSRDAAN